MKNPFRAEISLVKYVGLVEAFRYHADTELMDFRF